MKIVTLPLIGIAVLALTACGGSTPAPDSVVSNGIYSLELPTDAERAALSTELNDAIDSIQTLNETGTAANPGGDLVYTGVWGSGIDNGDGTEVYGTVAASFTAATNSVDITMTATDDNIVDADVTGSLGATDVAVADGLFADTLTGTLTATETGGPGVETFDATANMRGATVGTELFGDMEGTITNTTMGSPDMGEVITFGGLFYGG
ncbi:MAG: hypothetical protein GKR98_12685 [Boseongicola sp.]|nr:MAG: hypothetical protein GKR98_12685 [Boseongicola sp.]